jgi:hypothetical protein
MKVMISDQHALQAVEVDQVRERAEDEQQQPDPQVDLDRMLHAFAVTAGRAVSAVRCFSGMCLRHAATYHR